MSQDRVTGLMINQTMLSRVTIVREFPGDVVSLQLASLKEAEAEMGLAESGWISNPLRSSHMPTACAL